MYMNLRLDEVGCVLYWKCNTCTLAVVRWILLNGRSTVYIDQSPHVCTRIYGYELVQCLKLWYASLINYEYKHTSPLSSGFNGTFRWEVKRFFSFKYIIKGLSTSNFNNFTAVLFLHIITAFQSVPCQLFNVSSMKTFSKQNFF